MEGEDRDLGSQILMSWSNYNDLYHYSVWDMKLPSKAQMCNHKGRCLGQGGSDPVMHSFIGACLQDIIGG